MFTSDFVVSMVVFLTVMNLGFFALYQSTAGESQFNEQKRMARQAYQTADLLVRTPGYPADWNRSTVQIVGLAEPDHVVQAEKLLELKRTDQDVFRSRSRLAGTEFFLDVRVNGSVTSIGGIATGRMAVVAGNDSSLLDHMDDSGERWDLYWFGGSVPETNASTVMTGDAASMMDAALTNRSLYAAIIGWNTGVDPADIPSPGRVETFVDGGGVYLQEGEGRLIEEFGVTVDTSPSVNGTAVDTGILREEIGTGDTVGFDDPAYGFGSVDTTYVDGTSLCLVCSWRDGGVYYVADDTLTPATREGIGVAEPFVHDRWLPGTNTTYGVNGTREASQVLPSSRRVLLNRSNDVERATLRVILWR